MGYFATFGAYFRTLALHGRGRLALALSLLVVLGLVEGSGLLVLLPLLTSIGLGRPSDAGGVQRFAILLLKMAHVPFVLPALLAVFLGLVAIRAGLRAWVDILNARIEISFTDFLRERIYRAVVRADWLFFLRQRSSDVTHAIIEELSRVGYGTQQMLALLSVAGVSLVQVGLAFVLSPVLTLLVAACGTAFALTLHPLTRRIHRLDLVIEGKRSDMAAAVIEHLGGMKVAKSHGREARHFALFDGMLREIAGQWSRAVRLTAVKKASFEIGIALILSAFIYSAVSIVRIDPAKLVLIGVIFVRLLSSVAAIQDTGQGLAQALPSFAVTEKLRQRYLGAAESVSPEPPRRIALERDVRFENVSFHYDPALPFAAIQDVSLIIPARQVTAFCGASGAGKSTLADLLLGLLRPTEGRILIDSAPLLGRRLHDWRQSIGYVSQETFLFHDTVRANLLWAQPSADEADLQSALRAAAADQFVSQLPCGLDTVIGDRGMRLSGGERQRLALARALLRKPALLVLDEATSSLDTHNERLIQDAIKQLHGEFTIVVIAHRLSTVRTAEQIAVLERGRLVEIGTWSELAGREDGAFRQLIAAGLGV